MDTPTEEYEYLSHDHRTHVCPVCRPDTDGTVEADLMLRAGALASWAKLFRHDPDAKRIILVKSLDILNKLLEVDVPHL